MKTFFCSTMKHERTVFKRQILSKKGGCCKLKIFLLEINYKLGKLFLWKHVISVLSGQSVGVGQKSYHSAGCATSSRGLQAVHF